MSGNNKFCDIHTLSVRFKKKFRKTHKIFRLHLWNFTPRGFQNKVLTGVLRNGCFRKILKISLKKPFVYLCFCKALMGLFQKIKNQIQLIFWWTIIRYISFSSACFLATASGMCVYGLTRWWRLASRSTKIFANTHTSPRQVTSHSRDPWWFLNTCCRIASPTEHSMSSCMVHLLKKWIWRIYSRVDAMVMCF